MKQILSMLIIALLVSGIGLEVSAAGNNSSATSTTAATTASSTDARKVTVAAPESFIASENLNNVTLSWKRNKKATGYLISRSTDKETWQRVATIKNNKTVKYVDYTAFDDVLYYYCIKSYKKVNGKNYYSTKSNIIPIFFGVNFYSTSYSDSVMLNWNKVKNASGYEIYYSTTKSNFKKIKTIKDNNQTSYTKIKLTPYETKYYFYLKAYKNVNSKKTYLYQSDIASSNDLSSIINGSVGKPKSSFKTYNVQGEKATVAYTTSITSADKKIFNKFNAEHFTKDMSPYYRIYYTFMFIHKKVTYATGSKFSKCSGCTYADAIFNKRLGQCAQYNGAMVEYLANLGFNVKLIMGYRGKSNSNKWQHFWGQVKLNDGKTYVIETGNYGNDGDWNYFFKTYKQTKKYIKCGKYVSGIKA